MSTTCGATVRFGAIEARCDRAPGHDGDHGARLRVEWAERSPTEPAGGRMEYR